MTEFNLARAIEQTLLKPEVTEIQIRELCLEALAFNFRGVCTNSRFVAQVGQILKSSETLVVTVVGFPLGTCSTQTKASETEYCVKQGSQEIDMVVSIGALKEKNWNYAENDIRAVVQAAGSVPVKVILETALLTTEEKIKACELSLNAGAQFVKTCTGFGGGGATVQDIELMKSVVGNKMQIKASGGIKNTELALALIKAGASRLGTSSGVALVQNNSTGLGY
jgi:deoxyribose-phosphate aldolase